MSEETNSTPGKNDESTLFLGSHDAKSIRAKFAQLLGNQGEEATNELEEKQLTFIPVPDFVQQMNTGREKHFWRLVVEIHSCNPVEFIGLDLYGDVVLGRARQDTTDAIVDLTPYGAERLGVSRKHIILRPTANMLYAIDMGSTNKTHVNGVEMQQSLPVEVKNGDAILMGDMYLRLQIVAMPSP